MKRESERHNVVRADLTKGCNDEHGRRSHSFGNTRYSYTLLTVTRTKTLSVFGPRGGSRRTPRSQQQGQQIASSNITNRLRNQRGGRVIAWKCQDCSRWDKKLSLQVGIARLCVAASRDTRENTWKSAYYYMYVHTIYEILMCTCDETMVVLTFIRRHVYCVPELPIPDARGTHVSDGTICRGWGTTRLTSESTADKTRIDCRRINGRSGSNLA